ncbi:MAG: FAD-dependent oxidoreductase [Desulfarculaceae bacterium]|nr:FAD-dependent oxidoreductase [Desulfarculaceae bacterium]MCF8071230.1 FAD-dependent oxidoreductase [Desulfarculaceae bacterium]MCF8101167.1 FAD-dependent oxidoreductase [Desulfarculaceae bacterium]MCF8115284.1 FAD-dependent oxidoreductase [Desulfarculaceae bacterium]
MAQSKKVGAVMVVGAGIAGVQASLDLANAGYYVYLVEKTSAIGGRMAQLDKTFPTNDCAMCIISPKLVECGRHLNIEIITQAEVQAISGEAGDFEIKVHQEPRYVDMEACTACGDCIEACPVSVPNEFDQGLSDRKATFKRYAQAFPNAYSITKLDRAPCLVACPANLNVQGYVQMAKTGNFAESLNIIMKDLPLPGVIGRICPHPCEDSCRRMEVDEAVAIRDIKRFVADEVGVGNVPQPECEPRGEKVAIVGAGPAGLSCAYHLARAGVKPVIYEALPVAGGALATGVPSYRLPMDVLQAEVDMIKGLGVEIKLNTPIGGDLTFQNLRDDHDAVFLGVGAPASFKLGAPGEDSEQVVAALDYLQDVSLGNETAKGDKVIVVGGGNVAVDAARTALRQGSTDVTMVMLESEQECPASPWEITEAEEEGIKFVHRRGVLEVKAEGNKASGLVLKQCTRVFNQEGRFAPEFDESDTIELDADLIITAIGQRTDLSWLGEDHGLELTPRGTIASDEVTTATNLEGVYAGGDAVTGPWIAIGAVAAGREAARSMLRQFEGQDLAEGRIKPTLRPEEEQEFNPIPLDMATAPRAHMELREAEARKGDFDQFELGLQAEQAQAEGDRCLNCGVCCECFQCVEACKAKAPVHEQTASEMTLNVGSVILAPGFDSFDPTLFDTYSYAGHPNVVSAMEFERILSASGPYQGHLQRPSDGVEPKKIAWLQCVGSRDINHCDNGYCSAVCCMYAIKEAVIAKEHASGDLETSIFFMDMRTYGKDFEKYYDRAEDEKKVRFIRSRVHSVDPVDGDRLRIEYVTENGEAITEDYDMVVLSVGLQTGPEAIETAHRLGIDLTGYNFTETSSFAPVGTSREGIFACGAFAGPKDIPQAVMEASAAACVASLDIAESRGTLTKELTYPLEKDISEEQPRVGVFVCNCGINIGGVVDVPAVREYAATLPFVAFVDDNLFTCSQDTQNKIKDKIEEHNLNRVVVASCSPRTHEPLFQETIREAGLNKYLFEMANIRDQDSWVHQGEPEKATDKAKDLVRMAVAKAALIEPLHQVELPLNKVGVVVGGGVAGMVAALNLASAGYPVHLVEKTGELGGNARYLLNSWKGEDVAPYLADLVSLVQDNKSITLHLESELTAFKGFVGNYVSTISASGGGETVVEHGVVVLATGGHELRPSEYLYGDNDGVVTSLELDMELRGNPDAPKSWESVGFIQCVGSREPEHPYCSRLCCTHSVESAIKVKESNPEAQVYILYRDIRTYGVREDLYKRAREAGVLFIRYKIDDKPQVSAGDGKILVTATDHVLGVPVSFEVDRLVLAAAIVPNQVTQLAEAMKTPLNSEGFFLEAHAKLRPVDFATEGIYQAGLAHYPKPIDEAIAQANAAAGRALTVLAKNLIRVGGVVATVDPNKCSVCLTCVRTCPYGVPKIVDGAAKIEVAQCYGCGACAAECPGKAITLQHFTDAQILAKEKAAMG